MTSDKQAKILLVEDNEAIANGLKYSFASEGYDVVVAGDVKTAQSRLNEERADVIILVISLPDGDGCIFYEKVVEPMNVPTIFLTAKDDEETIVSCLSKGAEDYLTKPFRARELSVRVEKILRRRNANTIVKVQDIEFDLDKMVVYKDGNPLELTALELKILHLLFTNINKVVRRNTIIDKVWEWTGNDIEDNTLTVYLKRIREKIGSDIIVTLKGIGYRIDDDKK